MNLCDHLKALLLTRLGKACNCMTFVLHLIRTAMVWLIPAMVISSLLIFAANLLNFLQYEDEVLIAVLLELHSGFISLLPYMLSVALGSMLALHLQLPRPQVAVLCMVSLFAVQILLQDRIDTRQTYSFILGIASPLLTVKFIHAVYTRRVGRLVSETIAGNHIRDSLNLIIPGLIAVVLSMAVLSAATTVLQALPLPSVPLDPVAKPLQTGATVAFLNSFYWFFGVHGYYASLPVLQQLMHPELFQSDVINLAFLETYVFIGGSGATAGFVAAILLRSRNRMHRRIAMISLPLALFGINEVLLFCLPIILNPRLFLPFVTTPLVLTLVSVAALETGWVSFDPHLSLPNAPVLVNAWLVSGGGLGGPLLQFGCFLLSILIYLPFVSRIAQRNEPHEIQISQLNATFVSSLEISTGLEDDPILNRKKLTAKAKQLESSFEYIKDLTFELHYQPKIDPHRKTVVGAEALIRAREAGGKLVFPDRFLPSFHEAGMSRAVDLWVAHAAVEQIETWRQCSGPRCPIGINISAETLADRATVDLLLDTLTPCAADIRIELTEQTLASTEAEIDQSIARLKQAGVRLDIDDFGTGYSSLSYLSRFDPDAIKIDRSFVNQTDTPRGSALFHSLVKFAHSLNLDVVVEGLETGDQLAHLARYQNISVQGWYYAKAMPAEALEGFVTKLEATLLALD